MQFHAISSKHSGCMHDRYYWSSLAWTSQSYNRIDDLSLRLWQCRARHGAGQYHGEGPGWEAPGCLPSTWTFLSKDTEVCSVFKLCSGAADPGTELFGFPLHSARVHRCSVVSICCVHGAAVVRSLATELSCQQGTLPTMSWNSLDPFLSLAFFSEFWFFFFLHSYELFSIQCHWINSFLSYYILPLVTVPCSPEPILCKWH